jgi:hypothetical protein
MDVVKLAYRRIPPLDFVQLTGWDAGLLCGPAAEILLAKDKRRPLSKVVECCLEGWRATTATGTVGYDERATKSVFFRQMNIDTLYLRHETEHWNTPVLDEEWCVRPGDVVLTKIQPVRAAWVTSKAYRHPVDGNCILIRGSHEPTNGFWPALCLNHAPYQAYVLRGVLIPRVSLGEVREMPIPAPPEGAEEVARAFWNWNDSMLENAQALAELTAEVEAYIKDEFPIAIELSKPSSGSLREGRFFAAAAIEDSLVPNHVELVAEQQRLIRRYGWLRLLDLVGKATHQRDRLSELPERGRYLRLSDVAADFYIQEPEEAEGYQWSMRIYRRPLANDEVLISTLVTNPRTAYVDELPNPVYATDHWVRLHFRECPAAWALVLNTKPIRAQLQGMALGTVQQFTNFENIMQLLLPPVPAEKLARWEKLLKQHHQRRRELDKRWHILWEQAEELYRRGHSALVAVGGGR